MARQLTQVGELAEQADVLLEQLNKQIHVVEQKAGWEKIDPYKMQYADGHYVLASLLEAKANTLLAISNLNLL